MPAVLPFRCRQSIEIFRLARGNEQGSVIPAFAVLVFALVGFAGLAVDYGRVEKSRAWLQNVLDSAALAAVQEESLGNAKTRFKAYVDARKAKDNVAAIINADVESFDGVTIRVKGNMTLPLTLASLFWKKDVAVPGNSVASRSSGYQDFYFAVDLSGSFGVAATQADRDDLQALTQPYVSSFYGTKLPQGCAFACHGREGWEPDGKTVYQMAREAGIRLREDELVGQFNDMIDVLLDPNNDEVARGMRRVSVLAFSNSIRQLIMHSTSASDVKGVLANFPQNDRYDTHFGPAFSELTRVMGNQGDGSQAKPVKTAVLITDGIESRSAFFAQKPIDLSLCTQMKSDGFRLAVVELKYPKLEGNEIYRDTVLPVETEISPQLAACASPGWYFQALDHDEIPARLSELTARTTQARTRLLE